MLYRHHRQDAYTACLNNLGDSAPHEGEVGNKGILIAGEGQFDPIDFKGSLAAVQWQLIHIAVGCYRRPAYDVC